MRSIRSTSILALVASALIAVTAGCSSGTTDAESAPAAADDGAFPRTISHDLGETVIPEQPTRIAALTETVVDGSVALGVQVVALTDLGLGTDTVPDYLGEEGEELVGDAVVVGPLLEPSLEKIAATQPDLIISQTSRHEGIYDQLSQIAPTVMSDQDGAGWREIFRLLAAATATETEAEALISDYETRAGEIAAGIEDELGHAPTAAPIRFSGGATVRLYLENSFAGSVLKDTGFVLSDETPTDAAGSRVDVSQENLLMLDAEYLFISSTGDEAAEQQAETFSANPLWNRLTGEVVNVRDDTWITALSLPAANSVLDDLEEQFGLTG